MHCLPDSRKTRRAGDKALKAMPCISSLGLTQVEEMLISVVLLIMSLYQLPHGQFAYNGHVINLPQDVACFAYSLPRLPSEHDIIVIRKEGAANSHHDFHFRRAIVLHALQWLHTNNKYYHSVNLNPDALALLPKDGNLTGLHSPQPVTTYGTAISTE